MRGRPNFSREYVEREFSRLDKSLQQELVIYVLGGSCLAFYGLKEATKDIDAVLDSAEHTRQLIESLKSIDYIELLSLPEVYQKMKASAILENRDGFRWDVFDRNVCNALFLSDSIRSRSTPLWHGKTLEVFGFAKEDIFLFKSITERNLDLADMRVVAESGIDWDLVLNECKLQSDKSGIIWETGLYDKVRDLRLAYGIRAPFERQVREIAEDKMMEARILKALKNGKTKVREIAREVGFSDAVIRAELKKLIEKGKVKREAVRPYLYLPVG